MVLDSPSPRKCESGILDARRNMTDLTVRVYGGRNISLQGHHFQTCTSIGAMREWIDEVLHRDFQNASDEQITFGPCLRCLLEAFWRWNRLFW